MGITRDQDIPDQPKAKQEGWSIRKLLSLGGAVTSLTKIFNAFEILFAVMLLITGAGELTGKEFSIWWYLIFILLLLAAFAPRVVERGIGRGEEKSKK